MQKTNWIYITFLIILTVWVVLFVQNKTESLKVDVPVVEINRNIELQEKIIGNLHVKYSKKVLIENELDKHISFIVGIGVISQDEFEKVLKNQNLSVDISYLKNINPNKLSLKDWVEKNGRYNGRQMPVPDEEKEITISNIPAIEDIYYGSSHSYAPYLYDTRDIYFSHGTDIYEIWGYKLPDTPDPALTPADIQSAREYEQIFNQILASFKFAE